MKFFKAILIIGLGLHFSACSLNNEDEGTNVANMRNSRGPEGPHGNNTVAMPSNTSWGKVTSSQTARAYNTRLKNLLATSSQQEPLLGYVDPAAQSTGVFFWGAMQPAVSGLYLGRDTESYFSSLKSNPNNLRLNIQIWDEYAGKEYESYGVLNPYIFYFGRHSNGYKGSIDFHYYGSNAFLIKAKDKYGEIVISGGYPFNRNGQQYGGTGGISNQTTSGTVYYSQSSTGNFSLIGEFQVKTCGFFVCQ